MAEPEDVLDPPRRSLWTIVRAALHRASSRGSVCERSAGGRVATVSVVALAGLMGTVGALAAQGGDLRGGRNEDLSGLVVEQVAQNKRLQADVAAARAEVDALSAQDASDPALALRLETASRQAGATAVRGPALKVVLTDAPLEIKPEGVADDLLVVHQQDIQMVVNLLWSSGAEAMTIQGQRVISTTGVKCVGNSVVLHGVPYAPPYEVVAIGDTAAMTATLDSSPAVAIYKQYAAAYNLGWRQSTLFEVTMPAYQGSTTLQNAGAVR